MTAVAEYDGIRVVVRASDADASTWLQEFLRPSFTFEEPGARPHRLPMVELVADDAAYEAESRRASGAGKEMDCFRADGPTLRLPLWRESASERVFADRRNRAFYRMDVASARHQVLARPNDLAPRFAWMRLVRELVIARVLGRGDAVLHGAALRTDAGGLVLAGEKRAGKTTLLLNALRAGGASFLTNDRAVLRLVGDDVVVGGMPTVVSLRAPTLEDHPDTVKRLQGLRWDHRLALGEEPRPGARCAFPRPGTAIDLSPAQFAALLDVPMAGRGPLRAIAFIERSPRAGGITVRKLSAAEATVRLSSATLFGEGRKESALASAEPNADGCAALLATVRERVPMFEWLVGDGGHLGDLRCHIEETLGTGRPAP